MRFFIVKYSAYSKFVFCFEIMKFFSSPSPAIFNLNFGLFNLLHVSTSSSVLRFTQSSRIKNIIWIRIVIRLIMKNCYRIFCNFYFFLRYFRFKILSKWKLFKTIISTSFFRILKYLFPNIIAKKDLLKDSSKYLLKIVLFENPHIGHSFNLLSDFTQECLVLISKIMNFKNFNFIFLIL